MLGAEQLPETSTCPASAEERPARAAGRASPVTALVKSPWAAGGGRQMRVTGNALTVIKAANDILNHIRHS